MSQIFQLSCLQDFRLLYETAYLSYFFIVTPLLPHKCFTLPSPPAIIISIGSEVHE